MESDFITLYEDNILKIIMPKDFLEHPERYKVGQGVQHIYKRKHKIDEQSGLRNLQYPTVSNLA
jgi:hypothetical protein